MKVIGIVGKGRSGSTMLDRLLGENPGFVSVGELWHRRGHPPMRQLVCSCGRNSVDCPMWGAVIEELEHRFGAGQLDALERLERSVHSWHQVPRLLATRNIGSWPAMADVASYVAATYEAILQVTDSHVVVDSSKWPFHVAMLGFVDLVDIKPVHLVRDPRAVAHSWAKGHGSSGGLPQYGNLYSALSWVARNLGVDAVVRREPSIRVRYEDLASDPDVTLRSLLEFVGEDVDAGSTSKDTGTVHILGGNPMKYRQLNAIRPDVEWESEMPERRQRVVWALTGWLAKRYGYSKA